MAVNWALGVRQSNPLEAFTQAFEQGRERKRQDETRNALMAYAQNPSEQGLNALAQYAPEVAIQERGRFQQQQIAGQEREQEGLQRRLEMVGRVASMADTPEKWDAGVDYLVQQGYDDLSEYKGRFTPELRESAMAAAMDPEKYVQRNQPVNLGPGSMLVDPRTGKTIAQAPFAPRPVTLNPGQTAVEYDPNTPNDPEGIFSRMIHTESRGRQFGANGQPLTSPAGAIGIAQVMPGTAPEAAALAGVAFDENRYRTDPEYNAALGRAYFQKQLADFGDERQAVAAYNAGPGRIRSAIQRGGENWESFLPAETKGYLQSVFGGGLRVIGRGDPKPAPDARGAPPSGYRWKANGELEPIPGGPANKGGNGKVIPSSTENRLSEDFGVYSALNRAVSGFKPDFAGNALTGGLESIAQGVLNVGTPGQRDWWADFRQTDNLIRNQMFGSALTAPEKAAYEATTVSERMAPAQVERNIKRRFEIVQGALRRRARTLAAQGYNREAIIEMFGNEPAIVGNLPAPGGQRGGGDQVATSTPSVSNW